MKEYVTVKTEELLIQLWAAGYTVPEDKFEQIIAWSESAATVGKKLRRSEALFIDRNVEISPDTRAAFTSVYSRYTTKRGYAPLIRNDWVKFQRELAQLQTLVQAKQCNLIFELESIMSVIFTRFVKEREFRQALSAELQSRLVAMQLNSDVNSKVFEQLQAAYIKIALEKGYEEYVTLARASLEPFAKLVDLADATGADLTNLFYAQFHVNWGREFPKPSNLYDNSAMGRYADYCAKLKEQ